jgi:seryl-tRNA synthetase
MHGNRTVSVLATVYRHEEGGFDGLLRLWEFKVREFVFVGERGFVEDMLERTEIAAGALAQRLRIETDLENASDHFYPTRENAVRQKMQLQSVMKRELVTGVNGRKVSLSSFNFHGTHFSGPYGFDEGDGIVTGCVGFGLHRWLAAWNSALLFEGHPRPHTPSITKGAR